MFLPIMFNSVNSRSMITQSTLVGTCSHYRSLDDSADILFFEYDSIDNKRLVACDLLVYTQTNEVILHDYLLLKDNDWRDSFGEVSTNLSSLLPEIILKAKLIKREPIDEFFVGDINV